MNMHSIFNPVLFPFPSVSDILWLLKPRGLWWKPHNSFLLQRAIFEVPKIIHFGTSYWIQSCLDISCRRIKKLEIGIMTTFQMFDEQISLLYLIIVIIHGKNFFIVRNLGTICVLPLQEQTCKWQKTKKFEEEEKNSFGDSSFSLEMKMLRWLVVKFPMPLV